MSFQYLTAAKLVEAAEKGKSLKSLCATMPKLGKMEYALAMQTLKFTPVLREMMSDLNISAKSLDVKSGLLLIMLYELVFGIGKISGGGVVKRKIMEYKERLLQLRDSRMIGKSSYDELLSDNIQVASQLPIYVRINQAKMGIADGLQYLRTNYDEGAMLDDLIPSLVILPPNCKGIAQDKFIKDGSMVIQDKASCFPAQILYNHYRQSQTLGQAAATGCDFIDACAAPGNKTSHLAALLGYNTEISSVPNQSKKRPRTANYHEFATNNTVFAFDKSVNRIKIIEHRMSLLGVNDIVKTNHKDFLTVDVNDSMYAKVQYLLLDPSCSGSGIVRNIERIVETKSNTRKEEDENDDDHNVENEEIDNAMMNGTDDTQRDLKRLLKLQSFQVSVILKAMTFPNAHTISYSTCSIHEEENEQVVANVLSSDIGTDWEVVSPVGFDGWTHRGAATQNLPSMITDKLIRCAPEDGTNGFFVCVFKRKVDSEGKLKSNLSAKTSSVSLPVPTKVAQDTHKKVRKDANEPVSETHSSENKVTHKQSLKIDNISTNNEDKGVKSGKKAKGRQTSNDGSGGSSIFSSRFSVSKSKKRKFGKK